MDAQGWYEAVVPDLVDVVSAEGPDSGIAQPTLPGNDQSGPVAPRDGVPLGQRALDGGKSPAAATVVVPARALAGQPGQQPGLEPGLLDEAGGEAVLGVVARTRGCQKKG